eukprot:354064-Chlamydomonas_euryale.AAC.10
MSRRRAIQHQTGWAGLRWVGLGFKPGYGQPRSLDLATPGPCKTGAWRIGRRQPALASPRLTGVPPAVLGVKWLLSRPFVAPALRAFWHASAACLPVSATLLPAAAAAAAAAAATAAAAAAAATPAAMASSAEHFVRGAYPSRRKGTGRVTKRRPIALHARLVRGAHGCLP